MCLVTVISLLAIYLKEAIRGAHNGSATKTFSAVYLWSNKLEI